MSATLPVPNLPEGLCQRLLVSISDRSSKAKACPLSALNRPPLSVVPGPWPPPTPRGRALGAAALAHLLLLLLAWHLKPPLESRESSPARRSSTLRLLAPTAPSQGARPLASALVPPPPPPASLPIGLRTQVSLMMDPAEWGSAPTPSPTAVSSGPRSSADTAQSFGTVGLDGAAAVPQGPASGPQRLAMKPGREVLRGSLANPATQDPRTNTPRPSVEEKIALGLNPDLCLKEERMADGTVRRYLAKRRVVPTAAQAYTNVRSERIAVCS